ALRHVKSGRLRGLGVGGTKRNPQLPDVPSIAERIPGYSATSWTALVAPPGTAMPIVEKLALAMAEITRMPEVKSRLIEAGDESFDATPAQMTAFLREERLRWSKVIKNAAITAQ